MQAVQIVLFVIVSALALTVVVYVAFPRLRVRSRPVPPREVRGPVTEPARLPPAGMLCPECRRDYPAGLKYCPTDSRALIPAAEAATGRGLGAGVTCPTCRRSFDVGKKFCPYDAEELVPQALARPAADRLPRGLPVMVAGTGVRTGMPVHMMGKICPNCAQRYDSEATFCGRDGSELVSVN